MKSHDIHYLENEIMTRRLEWLSAWEPNDPGILGIRIRVAARGDGIISHEVNFANGLGEGHVQPQCVIGRRPVNLKEQTCMVHCITLCGVRAVGMFCFVFIWNFQFSHSICRISIMAGGTCQKCFYKISWLSGCPSLSTTWICQNRRLHYTVCSLWYASSHGTSCQIPCDHIPEP